MDFLIIILSLQDWSVFFGRFHPLFVHLPIGFLMLIAVFEILSKAKKLVVSDNLLKIALLLTAISATFACAAGYLLSLEGGYNQEILDEHQWQGLGLAAVTWLAWVLKSEWLQTKFRFTKIIYSSVLTVATLLMFVAGHHGGNLTHGETYLTENTPPPLRTWFGMPEKAEAKPSDEKAKIANVNEAMAYQEVIHPIFKQKCEQCHNKGKMKGDLRMDEVSLFQKGGKNGVIFKANNVDESEFIKRILLPENDEHHMPPKGKNQITENELSLMKWWVEQGASFDKKISQLTVNQSVKPILASLGGGMGIVAIAKIKQDVFNIEEGILTKSVSKINESITEKIKSSGGLILPLSQNSNYVEITFLNNLKFSDTDANLLSIAPEQTIWLKLNDTEITDKSLTEVAKLKNLTRLHLENTKITDAGFTQIGSLPNLEYLNLIGTNVSDNALKNIASLKNLKKLYIWKTKITQAGVDNLKKILPNLNIEMGLNQQQITAFIQAKPDTVSDDVYKKK